MDESRHINVEQGSEEWLAARAGRVTASRLADVLATTKSGYAASRKNYAAQLFVERMTGEPAGNGFVSPEMRWGNDHEPEARALFEFRYGYTVRQLGLVLHPEWDWAAASPDGLIVPERNNNIGIKAGVEFKCPNTATHLETIETHKIKSNYYAQMQWNMECTDSDTWFFVSYDPRVKVERLQFLVMVVGRDEAFLKNARKELVKFNDEVDERVAKLGDLDCSEVYQYGTE
jgi:putative phage-type endonuclease